MSLEDALFTEVYKGKVFTVNGFTGNIKELCKHFGINYSTFLGRLEIGWDLEKSLIHSFK